MTPARYCSLILVIWCHTLNDTGDTALILYFNPEDMVSRYLWSLILAVLENKNISTSLKNLDERHESNFLAKWIGTI